MHALSQWPFQSYGNVMTIWRFSEFSFSENPLQLQRDGAPLKLRHQALQVLKLLIDNASHTVSHDKIRTLLWGDRAVDHTKAIPLIIRDIRAALNESAAAPVHIETVPRGGYRFVGTVQRAKTSPFRQRIGLIVVVAVVSVLAGLALWQADNAPTSTTPAERQFLKGKHLLLDGAPQSVADAATYFEEALALDERHAKALAGLADVAVRQTRYTDAEKYAALALDVEDVPRAHLVRAMISAARDWDWSRALEHTDRALALDTTLAEAWSMKAMIFTVLEDSASAIAASDRAYRADPVSALVHTDHGWFHYYARNYEQAHNLCREAEVLSSDTRAAVYCQLRSAIAMQDLPAVLEAARKYADNWPDTSLPLDEPGIRSMQDFHDWYHEAVQARHTKTRTATEALAFASMLVGEEDAALALLDEAIGQRFRFAPLTLMDPVFDPIRGRPAFKRLITRAGAGKTRE